MSTLTLGTLLQGTYQFFFGDAVLLSILFGALIGVAGVVGLVIVAILTSELVNEVSSLYSRVKHLIYHLSDLVEKSNDATTEALDMFHQVKSQLEGSIVTPSLVNYFAPSQTRSIHSVPTIPSFPQNRNTLAKTSNEDSCLSLNGAIEVLLNLLNMLSNINPNVTKTTFAGMSQWISDAMKDKGLEMGELEAHFPKLKELVDLVKKLEGESEPLASHNNPVPQLPVKINCPIPTPTSSKGETIDDHSLDEQFDSLLSVLSFLDANRQGFCDSKFEEMNKTVTENLSSLDLNIEELGKKFPKVKELADLLKKLEESTDSSGDSTTVPVKKDSPKVPHLRCD